jgi:hypothetical protein
MPRAAQGIDSDSDSGVADNASTLSQVTLLPEVPGRHRFHPDFIEDTL